MEISVRQGDTFWYYSQLLQIPYRFIVDSNPNLNPERLRVGVRVSIPGYVLTMYQIQPGDTLWAIARRFAIPLDLLLLTNQQIVPQLLQVGQNILLPQRITRKIIRGQTFYSSAVLQRDLRELSEAYPFIRREVIGYSVMGKPIEEIRIGRGSKRVHFNGSFHAHEWITTPVLIEFINEYLLALTNSTRVRGLDMSQFYESVELSIVPMVNPDGVDLVINGLPTQEPYRRNVLAINQGSTNFSSWKANIRGVDLNNQYPAKWEEEAARKPQAPAPRDFPGYEPLSEPEAIAMAQLAGERQFQRVLAFHTQGKVIYWGFEGLEPAESERIVQEFTRVSGYRSVQYVDSFAGYKDWFILEWQRPGYTIELGRGTNPLPLSQYPTIYQEALGIMLAGMYL
ncbi:M14 family metallopeptidase [Halalkalibacter urbisdiaboli]|uniref:M14 family metallopeptidase n=1 Tax=Halalkalibacter urbisdiaboli TaxID=1960589 RepID=UPI000B440902|nr:M14 family metallopeptidase [Halalkalibacter urbisdiaboli]